MFDSPTAIKNLTDLLSGGKDKIDSEEFEIIVVVDGVDFNYWTDCEITKHFDNIDEFSISAPFDPDNKTYRDIFRPFEFKEVLIYVNGDLELSGYFVNPKPSQSDSGATITIDGYAKCGILSKVTCDPESWPVEIDGLDLEEIINKLCAPYGIIAEYNEGDAYAAEKTVGKLFEGDESVAPKPDEMIWDFISKLAKQKGVILSSSKKGNVLIRTYNTFNFSDKIDDTIANIEVEYNGQNIASDIYAVSNDMNSSGGKIKANNPFVKNIYLPRVYKAGDVATGDLQESANAEAGRNQANSVSINVQYPGWKNPDGLKFDTDYIVVLRSKNNMLYNWADYCIRDITYKKTESAHYCQFTCTFVGALSGVLSQELPWREPPIKNEPLSVASILTKINEAIKI